MKTILRALLGSLLLSLLGCATTDPVTQAEIDSADCGKYPENYEALIKDYLHRTLIDPNSMMVEFSGQPYKGYCYATAIVPPGERFGYGVRIRVNAKNRLGGYVGWQDQVAYIRNGKVYYSFESHEELGPEFGPEHNVRSIEKLIPSDRKR